MLVDYGNDGIVTMTLNRPEKLNATSPEMLETMRTTLRAVAKDPNARVVILTGAGRGFSSGQDLTASPQDVPHLDPRFMPVTSENRDLTLFRHLPQPVIASVNGVAAGFGIALALMCDLRIASDRATFAALWLPRGIPPEGMAMFTLPQAVGVSKAMEISLLGKTIDAEEALRIGLINEIAPHDELGQRTREMALALAQGPPIAMALTKRTMYMGVDPDFNQMAQFESWALRRNFETEDRQEGIASFRERRPPEFKGR